MTAPTAELVASFHPSTEAQSRVEELLRREKAGSLTPFESAELDRYLQFEHIMRLAKAHARLSSRSLTK